MRSMTSFHTTGLIEKIKIGFRLRILHRGRNEKIKLGNGDCRVRK